MQHNRGWVRCSESPSSYVTPSTLGKKKKIFPKYWNWKNVRPTRPSLVHTPSARIENVRLSFASWWTWNINMSGFKSLYFLSNRATFLLDMLLEKWTPGRGARSPMRLHPQPHSTTPISMRRRFKESVNVSVAVVVSLQYLIFEKVSLWCIFTCTFLRPQMYTSQKMPALPHHMDLAVMYNAQGIFSS